LPLTRTMRLVVILSLALLLCQAIAHDVAEHGEISPMVKRDMFGVQCADRSPELAGAAASSNAAVAATATAAGRRLVQASPDPTSGSGKPSAVSQQPVTCADCTPACLKQLGLFLGFGPTVHAGACHPACDQHQLRVVFWPGQPLKHLTLQFHVPVHRVHAPMHGLSCIHVPTCPIYHM
jgi:hypothetical protein